MKLWNGVRAILRHAMQIQKNPKGFLGGMRNILWMICAVIRGIISKNANKRNRQLPVFLIKICGALSKNRTCDSSLPRTCFTTRLLGRLRFIITAITQKSTVFIKTLWAGEHPMLNCGELRGQGCRQLCNSVR